jgi:2-polyprenyl-3-methyl-5-hydroxy-6-metoxy-1,4-benzoquinol methylase
MTDGKATGVTTASADPSPSFRACPVCGDRDHRSRLWSQRFAMPTGNGVHGGYDVVVCDRCGFAFAGAPPAQAYFDTYYRALAKKDEMLDASSNYAESDATIRRNDLSARYIAGFLQPGERVLEIGCYTGYLLARLTREVRGLDVVGLDPSTFAATVGRRRHRIDIRVGTIDDAAALEPFDAVIATHVLEHVIDLSPFLRRLQAMLKPEGRLFIEVPDAGRFESRADSRDQRSEPYFEFNFEHVNYFTVGSLTNLLESHGFHAVSVERHTSTLPVIASTWRPRPLTRDAEGFAELTRYLGECHRTALKISTGVAAISRRHPRFAVWGAGAHTQRLLAAGALDPARIEFFVDANPGFRGESLAGRPIVAPEGLHGRPGLAVLISSFRHEGEIRGLLHAQYPANEAFTLYDGDPA